MEKNNRLGFIAIIKNIIKKTLKFLLYGIAMLFAMNDKVGFPMQDELPKPKL